MSAYVGRCPLLPTTGFIYGQISIGPPRAKDAKVWYVGKVSDIIAGIPLPYRSVRSWSALDRPNGGTSITPRWTALPAVALHDPISLLYIIVWMPWIPREERLNDALSCKQDTVLHLKGCEQHRWMVTFIIRCSNVNVPRAAGVTHSSKCKVTWLMIGIIPLLHRTACEGLTTDCPGGGISFSNSHTEPSAAAPVLKGDVPMNRDPMWWLLGSIDQRYFSQFVVCEYNNMLLSYLQGVKKC